MQISPGSGDDPGGSAATAPVAGDARTLVPASTAARVSTEAQVSQALAVLVSPAAPAGRMALAGADPVRVASAPEALDPAVLVLVRGRSASGPAVASGPAGSVLEGHDGAGEAVACGPPSSSCWPSSHVTATS